MTKSAFKPSSQQSDFIDWCKDGKGNAILQAVAGAGKTTTILHACDQAANGRVAIAAFNKRIADEIKMKIAEMGLSGRVDAATFHALGFRSWQKVAGRGVKVEGNKLAILAEDIVPQNLKSFAVKLVSLAKQQGIGLKSLSIRDVALYNEIVEHHGLLDLLADSGNGASVSDDMVEEAIDSSINLLLESNKRLMEVIDFDDMLYAPLLRNSHTDQKDWVFVDEAQDSNAVRRMFVRKLMHLDSRSVFVGDERQAINGFAGADNEAMNSIRKEFNCIDLPLTVTYRCPKKIVDEARMIVSHIEAHETAIDGEVEDADFTEFLQRDFSVTDSILCRNTAPLVAVAYALIRRGVGCRVEGSDIGKGLMALANRWKVTRLDLLLDRIETFVEKRVAKLMADGKEVAAANLTDKAECLQVIIQALPPGSGIGELHDTIKKMFGDSDSKFAKPLLTLSTVHKSKGREWGTVYILGRNQFMPSPYARQEWQKIQEDNLIYVAITRAFEKLVYVNGVPKLGKKGQ